MEQDPTPMQRTLDARRRLAPTRRELVAERMRKLQEEAVRFESDPLEPDADHAVVQWVKTFVDRNDPHDEPRRYVYAAIKVNGVWHTTDNGALTYTWAGLLAHLDDQFGSIKTLKIATGWEDA